MTAELQLLAELRDLKTNGPNDEALGICQRVTDKNLLRSLWQHWPKFSGMPHYPVPHPSMKANDAFYAYMDLWNKEDVYCQTRYELLDWLIDQLSKT